MKLLSLAAVSVLTIPLILGCETSNRSYSQSGRVVDVTEHSMLAEADAKRDTPKVTPAAPSADDAGGGAGSLTEESLGSLTEESLSGASSESADRDRFANATASTGVQGYPQQYPQQQGQYQQYPQQQGQYQQYPQQQGQYQQYPQQQGQYQQYPQQQGQYQQYPQQAQQSQQQSQQQDMSQTSTSSGNWLLMDSNAARADESNTEAAGKALNKVNSSTAAAYADSKKGTAGPDQYRVVKGDTLYSIAFRYGLDYHSLAKINNIAPPYSLKVGQVLTLKLQASAPKEYVVQKGDTLFSIAKQHKQSVPELAGINNLEPPYSLKVGQKIRFSRDSAGGSTASKSDMSVPVAGKTQSVADGKKPAADKTQTVAQAKPQAPTNAATPVIKMKYRTVSGVTWSWPTSGRVVEKFSTAEQGNKGLDIEGKRGQAIFAASDGQVVYSGNALRGFGNLIIINHSNEFLSAYAHNDVLLVKEGQKVKRGQQIASMGNTDASSVRLHFEIRYRGQSVNPLSYLPK